MEGKLTVLRQAADEGNPTSSIQADNDNPGQAEEDFTCISAREDDGNPIVSSQAEERRPTAPSRADEGNTCVSVQEGSTLSVGDSISAPADLNSTPLDHVQETFDLMEESQEKTAVATVHLSTILHTTSSDVKVTQDNISVVSVHSSTLPQTTRGDVAMTDNSPEGELICKTMGSPAERTPELEGVLANADTTFSSPHVNTQAGDNINDEFLLIGDIKESVEVNNQTDIASGERVLMQEELPWNKGSIDNDAAIPESPDGNRRLSLKRSRSSCFDSTPCVQVVYKCLTSESQNKLKELLRQWAQWHGQFAGMKEEGGPLESGDETYFPALQVGGISNSAVSFWMDKPSKQARTENTTGDSTPASQGREKDVPLYDRAGTGALISQETEMSLEGLQSVEEGARCFNCGSYSHSLKDCPRPRDAAAISNARKLLAEKRGSANGPRSASRYYQTSPGGKFDDLKPGVLRSETRQLLGIGERDPPPWLNRMRELGYPPGYLEDQEEEQSGITIFGTNEDPEGTSIGEDGEIVGENKMKRSSSKKMIVHFPGVNAPIPNNADRHIWGSPADMNTHDRPGLNAPIPNNADRHIWGSPPAGMNTHDRPSPRVVGRSSHSSYSATADGNEDWQGPPGCGRDSYGRNSKMRSPGFEAPQLNKTPPWPPSEQGRLGIAPLPRSPHLSRSASDSGRRSPKVAYDEPYTLPPLGHYSSSRQSPHSSRSYHSPSTPNVRYPQRPDSREEDSRRRAWTHAQDALHSMHRNDRYSPARRR